MKNFIYIIILLLSCEPVSAQYINFQNLKTGRIRTFELPRKVSVAFMNDTDELGFQKAHRVVLNDAVNGTDLIVTTREGQVKKLKFDELSWLRMDRTFGGGYIYYNVMLISVVNDMLLPYLALTYHFTRKVSPYEEFSHTVITIGAGVIWIGYLTTTYLTARSFNRKFNSQRFMMIGRKVE